LRTRGQTLEQERAVPAVTATSPLKNAGGPESVAMDIIGHDSAAISRHYTHVEAKAKRRALNKLPSIG
jgi:hypothetical protein